MVKTKIDIEKDKKFWVAINVCQEIGPGRFKKLKSYFESMEDAWNAGLSELIQAGLDEKSAGALRKIQKAVDPDVEMEKLANENVSILLLGEKKYPKLLSEVYDPPAILYLRGEIEERDELSIAVVGTRKTTIYGRQATPPLVSAISASGLTVVSGLALGIDTLAHESALEAGGRTIAVLACGLESSGVYPPRNRNLAEKICEGRGALISEYHLGTPPLRQHFPARNRIISGLSLATLVVEAGEKSGALLTAKHSLEQGRDVFAVPGNITNPASKGPNNLIKMGAKLISGANDILDELEMEGLKSEISARKIVPDTKEEAIILKILSDEPTNIDKLVKKSGLDTSNVSATLTMMEMKGKVRNVGGANYVIKR